MRLKIDLPANNYLGEVGALLILENIKLLSVTYEEKRKILKAIIKNMQN